MIYRGGTPRDPWHLWEGQSPYSNVLQFVRHNRSDAPRIIVVIQSSTSTTKIFLSFPCRVSEVAAHGLLHQLPQEADFSLHGVVFSKDALKSVHLIDMDGK